MVERLHCDRGRLLDQLKASWELDNYPVHPDSASSTHLWQRDFL